MVETEDEQARRRSRSPSQPPPGLDRALERGPVRIECVSAARHPARHRHGELERRGARRAARPRARTTTSSSAATTVRVQAVGRRPRSASTTAASAARATTTTVNLSGTGLLLRDPLELAIGTPRARARARRSTTAAPPLAIDRPRSCARPAATRRASTIDGDLAPRTRTRLTRFITERQRAELRIARGG